MSKFNLMILAAGYGKRMNNLTDLTPKPLLKINNKELLKHNIDFFTNLGCEKIVINTHYLHDKIQRCLEESYSDRKIIISYESQILNTGGGIKNALSALGKKNFVVTNSDILWKEENKKDVLKFINNHQDIKTCKLLLAADNNFKGFKKPVGDFMYQDGILKRWKKNDPHLFYTGLQIINPVIFNLIKDNTFSINRLWDLLISINSLEGVISDSNIVHIGDKNAFNQFK